MFESFRLLTTTLAPLSASRRAIANPILRKIKDLICGGEFWFIKSTYPSVEPVITAVFPTKFLREVITNCFGS